jgi:hypothetical protein
VGVGWGFYLVAQDEISVGVTASGMVELFAEGCDHLGAPRAVSRPSRMSSSSSVGWMSPEVVRARG